MDLDFEISSSYRQRRKKKKKGKIVRAKGTIFTNWRLKVEVVEAKI